MLTTRSLITLTAMFICHVSSAAQTSLPIEKLTLPEGYHISIFANEVKNARQMAISESGIVFVGSREAGVVHAVIDSDKDGVADRVINIAQNLNMPSGLAIRDGDLYVAEVDRILKYTDIEAHYTHLPAPEVVVSGLPTEKHHGWKYIDFGPDGWLYVPIGAPCNICETTGTARFDDPRFASILRFNLSTGEKQWVAKGVRNSVGFDWHPQTQQFWFSDNGRDMLGDDIPPCEINAVETLGEHFGYPYFHGGSIADPEFGENKNMADYTVPKLNLMAHVAPLGVHFYAGSMFENTMNNRLFVAEHGSWNRTQKSGYRVMMASVKAGQVIAYEPFVQGWLNDDNTAWGRPAAITTMADGSMLIADDFANVIYRVTYQKP
ncbi:PQQ-dependent sugar dehydrogenase [Flavobacterium sp. W21_SRS_FM6]|uniref:PQQ-dependent sugar dehydrogenase n=1 Tax=Flavobacterium sp. W21_SRS_FM6 TaxID=3240268 RepID=UPI003F926A5F